MGNNVLFGDTNNAINSVDPSLVDPTMARGQITLFNGLRLPMGVPLLIPLVAL